jgi:tetratricopeptide (TPR) repeat protein
MTWAAPGGTGPEPYPGLRAFESTDSTRFFGRRREVREIAALWRSSRLLTLYGPSGVGKTSLLQAGVIPLVDDEFADVLPVGRLGHRSTVPTAVLPDHNPYVFALLSSLAPADTPTRLSGLRLVDFLREQRRRHDRYGDQVPLFLAIDQFEETVREAPERRAFRQDFVEQLVAALHAVPDLRLLVAVREDFLAGYLELEAALAPNATAHYRLRPLSADEALEAVREPLAGTGRRFAAGVAEELVEQLRTSTITDELGRTRREPGDLVEPVELQVVCSALWRALPADVTEITPALLRAHSDPRQTLTDFCAAAITDVARRYDLAPVELRDWVERTFVTEHGRRNTTYQGTSSTAGMRNEVAAALEERRILRVEHRSGSRWYELQHDRLIDAVRALGRRRDPEPARTGPRSADYLRAAESALADGEFELAEKQALEALRSAGRGSDEQGQDLRLTAEAESFLGNLARQRDDATAAQLHYQRAVELFNEIPDNTAVGRLLAAIGRLLLERGEVAQAVGRWQSAAERLPGDLTLQVQLADALVAADQPRAARAVYNKVLELAADFPEALAGRAAVLAELDDGRSALRDVQRLRVVHPERGRRPDVRSALGLALSLLGQHDDAAAELAAALRDSAEDGTVLLRAARAAHAAGDPARAAELAGRALVAGSAALPDRSRAQARRLAG